MREIITIHVGQAGIQLGNACWELFCLEHNIQPDGYKSSESITSEHDAFAKIFSEDSATSQKYTARSVFIDLEPDSIDQLRTGTYRELFPTDQLISGKEDKCQNFARSYGSGGKQYIDTCLDRIRKVADDCTDLEGFIIFNSVGGGTGSGLGSLLLERLSADYQKKSKFSIPIYPSFDSSTSTLEPYNAILATTYQMDHISLATLMENDALSNICTKHLQIEKPGIKNINSVAAHMVSLITTSIRYNGAWNGSLREMQSNLFLDPTFPFTFASYAPFVREEVADEAMSVKDILKSLYSADCMSIKCDPNEGKYMAATCQLRGNYTPKDISPHYCEMKWNGFANWCTTPMRCEMNWEKPVVVEGSGIRAEKKVAGRLANSSAISQVFWRNVKAFDEMYKNRVYLECYLSEGMEEDDFLESREVLRDLLMDYKEIERENNEEIDLIDNDV